MKPVIRQSYMSPFYVLRCGILPFPSFRYPGFLQSDILPLSFPPWPLTTRFGRVALLSSATHASPFLACVPFSDTRIESLPGSPS